MLVNWYPLLQMTTTKRSDPGEVLCRKRPLFLYEQYGKKPISSRKSNVC
jgi:hypothetical protein